MATFLLAGALSGCDGVNDTKQTLDKKKTGTKVVARSHAPSATAILAPTKSYSANGILTLRQLNGVLHIKGTVSDLGPGKHGFHIHEVGDCSAADATSAGGHFDPHESVHGAPDAKHTHRHYGDLGNIVADAQGNATVSVEDLQLQLTGTHSIVGRALIVHAAADDLKSQPSGAAGPRVACALIEGA